MENECSFDEEAMLGKEERGGLALVLGRRKAVLLATIGLLSAAGVFCVFRQHQRTDVNSTEVMNAAAACHDYDKSVRASTFCRQYIDKCCSNDLLYANWDMDIAELGIELAGKKVVPVKADTQSKAYIFLCTQPRSWASRWTTAWFGTWALADWGSNHLGLPSVAGGYVGLLGRVFGQGGKRNEPYAHTCFHGAPVDHYHYS